MQRRQETVLWSEPDLAGYLEKRGRTWKKRLFLLQGHMLYYFLNEQQVRKAPSAVIPIEGSIVKLAADESNPFVFYLHVAPRYASESPRGTYILAADCHEALEAWVRMLKIASYSRDGLYAKLMKSRTRLGELKGLISALPLDKQLPECETEQGEDLERKLKQAIREEDELLKRADKLCLDADKREAAVAHSTALWNLFLDITEGKRSKLIPAIEYELKTIEKLYKLLQTKANLLQGQGIENLLKAAQVYLKKQIQHAMSLIHDRHCLIRARAPRYSFHVEPSIYEEQEQERKKMHKPRVSPCAEDIHKHNCYSRYVGRNVVGSPSRRL